MKQLAIGFLVFFLYTTSLYAATTAEVVENINTVQGSVPSGIPSAPDGNSSRGFVGDILAGIFTTGGKIKSEFIDAFEDVIGVSNNILTWNGESFEEGSITDTGDNIGINTTNPQYDVDIDGDLNFTGDIYRDGDIFSGGKFIDGTDVNDAVYLDGKVGIGTDTPLQQLHAIRAVRFDGGIQVDGLRAISATNGSHTTVHPRYGFFEGMNTAGETGFALGLGNGGDRVNFALERADKLFITGGSVGIGVQDPTEALHVDGNAIADDPVLDTHLTTKDYVDTQVANASGGKFIDGTDVNDAVYLDGKVGIGTDTPLQQLHAIRAVRFDGGIQVDGLRAISATNGSHTTVHPRYGFFEGMNTAGETGFALGLGNGGDRVNFALERADKLFITGGSVGIGVQDPTEALHVDGNAIADDPVLDTHLVTKRYFDNTLANFDPLPSCANGQILKHNGTRFVCGADARGTTGTALPSCANGQILKHNGTEFVCGSDNTGGSSAEYVYAKVKNSAPNAVYNYGDTISGQHICPSSTQASGFSVNWSVVEDCTGTLPGSWITMGKADKNVGATLFKRVGTGNGGSSLGSNSNSGSSGSNSSNSLPTPPTCSGPNRALGWTGSAWICNVITNNSASSSAPATSGFSGSCAFNTTLSVQQGLVKGCSVSESGGDQGQ